MSYFNLRSSKNSSAEIIRMLMPLMILFVILVVIKKFFGGAFDAAKAAILAPLGLLKAGDEKDEAAKKKVDQTVIDLQTGSVSLNPFSPGFMVGKTGALQHKADADRTAAMIKDAVGFGLLEPDYDQIFLAFDSLQTKLKVSWVADRFQVLYGQNLLAFLDNATGKYSAPLRSKFNTLVDKVMKLPVS